MFGLITGMCLIAFGVFVYIIHKIIKSESKFTFLHLLWVFLLISTSLFRYRPTQTLIENPLDSAGLFRVTLVLFCLGSLSIYVTLKKIHLPIRRKDFIVGALWVYVLVGFLSIFYSPIPQLSAYKVLEIFVDFTLVLAIVYSLKIDGLKLVFNITYVWLFLLLLSAWFWVPIKPDLAVAKKGVLNFLLYGVFPLQDADMVSVNAAILAIVSLIRGNFFKDRKRFYNCVFIFSLVSLVAGQARTSILGFFAAIIITCILLKKNWRVMLILACLIIIFLYHPLFDWVYRLLLKGSNPEIVFRMGGRLPWWTIAFESLKGSPFLGYGFGAGGRSTILGYYPQLISVFNSFLEIALNVGIIGLFFFLVAYMGTVIQSFRIWILNMRRNFQLERYLKCSILETIGIMVIVTFRSLTSFYLGDHGLGMLVFLPLAVFAQSLMYSKYGKL